MRKIFKNHQKGGMFFIILGLLMGFGALLLSQPSWAAGGKDPGNTTLCADTANRNVGTGSSDNISAGEKVKTGSRPLFLSFQTTVNNGLTFTGSSGELTLIQVPRSACTFANITQDVNADCTPNGLAVVNFNCSDAGTNQYNINDPAITPANQGANLFNLANALLGLNVNLHACDTIDDDTQKINCAQQVCHAIIDNLTNGDTKAFSTAGDLGQLIGSMQTTLDRCTASSSLVHYTGVGSPSGGGSCSPDDIAAATALALLQGAPAATLQLQSSGAGFYQVTALSDIDALGVVNGDLANIDMNSCVAAIQHPAP
jgi:hypothetical protein